MAPRELQGTNMRTTQIRRAGQTAPFTTNLNAITKRLVSRPMIIPATQQEIAAQAALNPPPQIVAPPPNMIDFNWITISVGVGVGLIGAFFLVPVIQKALAPAAKAAV